MTTLPRWLTKKAIQSQSVAEHMANTDTDLAREHLIIGALADSSFDSDTMRDSILHMYLNECRREKSKTWYMDVQKSFLTNHPQWIAGFDGVLQTRWEQGSKSQRSNQMGDWIALSQLSGKLLPMEMLFREKLRHPRDPRPPTYFVVPFPKGGSYRHAFELLYNSHSAQDARWDTLLSEMPLSSMTASLWDTYAKKWPDKLDKPVKSTALESHEWLALMKELLQSENAKSLANELVKRVQSRADGKLLSLFSREETWHKDVVHEPLLAQALYGAALSDATLRSYLSTQQLVHALNENPDHLKREFLLASDDTPYGNIVQAVLSPPYVEQLSLNTRNKAVHLLAQDPTKYQTILSQQFDKITSSSWSSAELGLLLSTPFAQALLVNSIMKGWANNFLEHCAATMPMLSRDLEAADFTEDCVLEKIAMHHLVPSLSHKDVVALTSMVQSLGLDEHERIAMYQSAIEGASSQNSLSIEGLVEASNDSAFPA